MDLSRDTLHHTIYGDLKRTIQLAVESRYFVSATIILLTAIDILGSLTRPQEQDSSTRQDFIRWADRYLSPYLPYDVTGEELYSARCAVLHTLGIESDLTRAGRARRVGFMVGGNMPGAYNPHVDPTLVLIRLETLVEAFNNGIDRFVVEAFADPGSRALVEPRLRKMLMAIPYENPPGD